MTFAPGIARSIATSSVTRPNTRLGGSSARDERGHPAQRRLLVGQRALGRLACRERRARPGALGGLSREHQRCERRDGDEELRREQAVGDRVAHERPIVLRRVPDRDRADDEDGRGGSARPEADRRPQQDREDDVGHIALWRQFRERHQHGEHDRAFHELAPVDGPQTRGRPREDKRCDDEDTGGVAEHPGAKHLPELVGRDHAAQPQRQRSERGTDHRRDQGAADEGEHIGDPIQPATPAREAAQEQRGDHDRDGVPERLGEHRPQRRRVVGQQQIADHDRGPQADAVEEQYGEAETGRRPQRRHRAVEVGQLEADATCAVVRERHDRDREHVERWPRVLSAAQGIDPLTHRGAAGAESAWGRCAHGLNAESPTSRTAETPARFRGTGERISNST